MTDPTANRTPVPVTEQEVVDYLRAHPDFFLERDELLESLSLPHDSGNAISLVERQVHLFREQRDTLRHELGELINVARHNDRLFARSKRLLMQVIEARTLNEVAAVIDDSIRGDFGLDAVSLLLFESTTPEAAPDGALVRVSRDAAINQLGALLDSNKAVCGQFRPDQREFLFPRREQQVESIALVPLRHGDLLGVFAVGSRQPGYFDDRMGTLFLSYISDTLSRLLPPLVARHGQLEPVNGKVAESGY